MSRLYHHRQLLTSKNVIENFTGSVWEGVSVLRIFSVFLIRNLVNYCDGCGVRFNQNVVINVKSSKAGTTVFNFASDIKNYARIEPHENDFKAIHFLQKKH